jgi:hypothetical protein
MILRLGGNDAGTARVDAREPVLHDRSEHPPPNRLTRERIERIDPLGEDKFTSERARRDCLPTGLPNCASAPALRLPPLGFPV